MSLGKNAQGFWIRCQMERFPLIDEVLGPVDGRHKKFLMALEMGCGALAFRQAFRIACRVTRSARPVS